MTQLTIEHRGKQVTAELSHGRTISRDGVPGDRQSVWYVTIAGTALTQFPASAADTEASVRRRVVQWLEEHPDLLDRDQIVLGGG